MYMIQSTIAAQALATIYRQKALPLIDKRYLLHCALGELYGNHSLKPWTLQSSTETTYTILGYTDADPDTLRRTAQLNAQPAVEEDHQLHGKEMPAQLPEGLELNFQVEACPVIRKASAGSVDTPNGTRDWREGQEIDIFLDRAWHTQDDISREDVYKDWLAIEGSDISDAEVLSYSFPKWVRRRGHGYHTIKRPHVYFRGTCTVTDRGQFANTLARGLGQHKTFGMGMIKVRAA